MPNQEYQITEVPDTSVARKNRADWLTVKLRKLGFTGSGIWQQMKYINTKQAALKSKSLVESSQNIYWLLYGRSQNQRNAKSIWSNLSYY